MGTLSKSLAATFYNLATSVGGQLLMVPLYVHAWGPEKYGSWLLLIGTSAYVGLLDLGVGQSFGNQLTISSKKTDSSEATKLLGAFTRFQIYATISIIASAVVIVKAFSVSDALGILNTKESELKTSVILLLLYGLAGYWSGTQSSILRTCGEFHTYLYLASHARAAELVVTIAVVTLTEDVRILAAAMLVVRIGLLTYTGFFLSKIDTRIKLDLKQGDISAIVQLIPSGVGFLSLPLSALVVNHQALLMLNRELGPASVVALSACRQIARIYFYVNNAISVALHPEYTSAYAAGNMSKVVSLYSSSLGIIAITILPSTLLLAGAGTFIIDAWLSKAVTVSAVLMAACSLESTTHCLAQNATLPAYATNSHQAVSCWSFLLNIVALAILHHIQGASEIWAIPVAFSVANLSVAIIGVRAFSKLSGRTGAQLVTCCIKITGIQIRDRISTLIKR
jgi:O-antigen/teichoic acid export membrane protein